MKVQNAELLRSKIAAVPQGPVLFSMSLINNIQFAKRNANEEEAVTAARVGNAHNSILECLLKHRFNKQVFQVAKSNVFAFCEQF
jgi:ABC-type bacteriocin/lantibiotic exporter with double-glycine peptidase domain